MDADFNTPDALAVVFDLARKLNTLRARADIRGQADTPLPLGGPDNEPLPTQEQIDRLRRTILHLLDVLGINLDEEPTSGASIGPFVELALDLRRKLREIKQWGLADEVRNRLNALGVVVEDKPGGESAWRLER